MSAIVISGDTSGSISLAATAVAGTNTLTLPAQTGTLQTLGRGTAVTASGTSVDFTGIPSWAKRITVMFSGVSTNGTSIPLVQIGSGSVTTTGYISVSSEIYSTVGTVGSTAGFVIYWNNAIYFWHGSLTLTLLSGNTWVASGSTCSQDSSNVFTVSSGTKTLSGALDRVRITTTNGTDTFDAGSINIMYEG